MNEIEKKKLRTLLQKCSGLGMTLKNVVEFLEEPENTEVENWWNDRLTAAAVKLAEDRAARKLEGEKFLGLK